MTEIERIERIEKMLSEIHHHLGLDGQRPLSMSSISQEAEKNVLKWRSKRLMKGHECAKSPG
jgi:hypothetical protein